MGKFAIILVMGGMLAIVGGAIYSFTLNQTNFIEVRDGEPVTVGPVEYTVTFEGTHKGSKEVMPENTFVMIGITAKNLGEGKTFVSGGQLFIVDEKNQRYEAVYGEFSPNDLLLEWIEPGKSVEKTTQFDIPYNEDDRYEIIIRPQKGQSTSDLASVCITNCDKPDT